MLRYEPDIYGCIRPDGYAPTPGVAVSSNKALKGRTRYTLEDIYPTYSATVAMDMNMGQFIGWQDFWIGLNRGTDWFLIDMLEDVGFVECYAHATGPFSATLQAANRWTISLPLEYTPSSNPEPQA